MSLHVLINNEIFAIVLCKIMQLIFFASRYYSFFNRSSVAGKQSKQNIRTMSCIVDAVAVKVAILHALAIWQTFMPTIRGAEGFLEATHR